MYFSIPLEEACLYSQNKRLENKISDFIFSRAVRLTLLELVTMGLIKCELNLLIHASHKYLLNTSYMHSTGLFLF